MSIEVHVGPDQDVEKALLELRKLVHDEIGRPWYKGRYGYYESPSELRRKRKKMNRLRGGGPALFLAPHGPERWRIEPPWDNKISNEALFARTGPTTSVAR